MIKEYLEQMEEIKQKQIDETYDKVYQNIMDDSKKSMVDYYKRESIKLYNELQKSFILGQCSCGCEMSLPRLRTRHGYLMLYEKGHNGANNVYVNTVKKEKKRY